MTTTQLPALEGPNIAGQNALARTQWKASADWRMPPPGAVEWEFYCEWTTDKHLYEWVEGEIVALSPATYPHQVLQMFFASLLTLFVNKYDLGEVLTAPYPLKLPSLTNRRGTGREPDVLYIAKANLHRVQRHFFDSAPDMVIEILSPSTARVDRGAKFREYQAAGVREYWMADPEAQEAWFYRLDADGAFQPVTLANGVFYSEVLPGFRLRPEWLWDAPLSHLLEIARKIGAV